MYTFREIKEAVLASAARGEAEWFPFGIDWREALLQVKTHPAYQGVLEEIREEAERVATEPLLPLSFSRFHLFEAVGTRSEYEKPYFDRRRRMAGLLFATLLDGEKRYISHLEDLLWEICNEYTWCVPAHLPVGLEKAQRHIHQPPQVIDLFAAITAHGLAETIYLLGGQLNPWIVHRVKHEIDSRILCPLYGEPTRFKWEASAHNWAAVCAGAVGMTALLMEKNTERLAGLLDRLLRAMESYLAGFQDDGGCPEGISYWTFGFGYYTYFAEMLERFTDGKLRLLDGDKLRKIAEFPMAASLSDGSFVNYSDASERTKLHTGMVSQLVRRYGMPAPYMEAISSFHQDSCYRFAHVSRNLLWSSSEYLSQQTPEGNYELENLQWVISRRKLNNHMVAFSAKGGHNAEPHNHNDLGHFILHAGNNNILTDLGKGPYTRDYFGNKRYTFLHTSSRGHSVPVIDGMEQQPGSGSTAKVVLKELNSDCVRLSLDITAAYPLPHLNRYLRQFNWSFDESAGMGKLTLSDRFEFTRAPHQLEEAFISLVKPTLEPDCVRWHGSAGTVLLRYHSSDFAAAVEAIPSKVHSEQSYHVYRLTLKALEPSTIMSFEGHFEIMAAEGGH